jgi:hypothetical protein
MAVIRATAIVAALFFGALLVIYDFDWQLTTVVFIIAVVTTVVGIVYAYVDDWPPQL